MQRITVDELDVFSDQQLFYRPIWRKCQHGLLLFQPAVAGSAVDCLVLTMVGYLVEPAEAFAISGFNVQHDADRSAPRHQRDKEALSGVAHHVFSFALCLCPERPAQARCEAHFFGELPEGRMEAMLTRLDEHHAAARPSSCCHTALPVARRRKTGRRCGESFLSFRIADCL